MTVPDAAIEAAVPEVQRVVEGWMNYDDGDWQIIARAAIEAAMPAIHKAILTDVRHGLDELLQSDHLPPGVEEHPEGTCEICDWVGCLQDEWLNDRIVRGGTP